MCTSHIGQETLVCLENRLAICSLESGINIIEFGMGWGGFLLNIVNIKSIRNVHPDRTELWFPVAPQPQSNLVPYQHVLQLLLQCVITTI